MTDRAPERLAVAAAVLAAAAAWALLLGARRPPSAPGPAEGFHRAVGGLGSGTATSLSPCESAFDPGLSRCCERGLDPAPGGFAFCPHHAGPSLRR